jgi:hypothetical protein
MLDVVYVSFLLNVSAVLPLLQDLYSHLPQPSLAKREGYSKWLRQGRRPLLIVVGGTSSVVHILTHMLHSTGMLWHFSAGVHAKQANEKIFLSMSVHWYRKEGKGKTTQAKTGSVH